MGFGTNGQPSLGLRSAAGQALLAFDLLLTRYSCWAHTISGSHQTPSASENPGPRGKYSYVVDRWPRSLGLDVVSDEVTFQCFLTGSDLSLCLTAFPER